MVISRKGIVWFFMRFRSWFSISALAVLVVVGGLFFWQSAGRTDNLEGLFFLEQAETAFSAWEGAIPADKEAFQEDLSERVSDLEPLSMKGESFARLQLLKGRYELMVQGNSEGALRTFQAISSQYYQYGPALLYQAFILEEQGDVDQALAAYGKLSGLKDPLFRSQGVFYSAVIREKMGEVDLAKSLYTSLANDYPEIIWGQLSKNRLIYLELREE